MTLLDDEEQYRINAFDWQAEFPSIFKGKDGGFDAVIGNPPWGAFFSDEELEYHRMANRPIIVRMVDSFMFFVYQMARRVRGGGRFGMILPDVILYQGDNEKLRAFILDNYALTAVLNLGDVFHKVTRPAAIIAMTRSPATGPMIIADFADLPKKGKAEALIDQQRFGELLQGRLAAIPGLAFLTKAPERYKIWEAVKRVPHNLLGDLVDSDGIQRGVSPDLKDAFIVEPAVAKEWELEAVMLRPVVTGGKEVRRFYISASGKQLIYTTRDEDFGRLPNIRQFIDQFKGSITCREVREKKHPIYSLHRPRAERIFTKPVKALGVITADHPIVAIDRSCLFATDGLYIFAIADESDLKYVLAILNSKLFRYVYRLLASEEGRVLAQVKPAILCQLPIRSIERDDSVAEDIRSNLIDKSSLMESLGSRFTSVRNPEEKTRLTRQLDATSRQIDRLVYDLYGLTDAEIAIIEAAGD